MDILDKHRTLVTVGQTIPRVSFMNSNRSDSGIRVLMSSATAPDLYVGQELFRESLDLEEDEGMLFTFRVVLTEPGIIEGKSLFETLRKIIDVANGLITGFDALFT